MLAEGRAGGRGVCFSAPLVANFGPGLKAVEEGRAAGRGVCFFAPLNDDIGSGPEVVVKRRAATWGVAVLCASRRRLRACLWGGGGEACNWTAGLLLAADLFLARSCALLDEEIASLRFRRRLWAAELGLARGVCFSAAFAADFGFGPKALAVALTAGRGYCVSAPLATEFLASRPGPKSTARGADTQSPPNQQRA